MQRGPSPWSAAKTGEHRFLPASLVRPRTCPRLVFLPSLLPSRDLGAHPAVPNVVSRGIRRKLRVAERSDRVESWPVIPPKVT